MVERGLDQMRRDMPEFFVRDDDPDFVDIYRRSYDQQLRFIYDGLASRRELDGREVPAPALEEARLSAGFGIELASVLLGYRITHRLIFDEAIDRAGERIADADLRAAVLRVTSGWLFAYIDWMTARVTEGYERERELLVRDRERRRRQLVRELLDGRPVDAAELGYRLDREHLAVVAWGDHPDRVLIALRDATGLALLTVAGTGATAWGWLGAAAIGDVALRAVRDFEPPAGVRLAIGEPARGAEGFRLAHRRAWAAYRIARDLADPVTWHADVALLALTLQDPAVARDFVVRELGPLAEDDERSELLRATLVAYFAAGQNAAAAAAALGVHDRTVLYRLRSIEDRLGRSILARREELGVALRLAPVVLRGRA
jgi:hypothetical protein